MPDNSLHPLDYIFHPKSIAVIGASPDPDSPGLLFLLPLVEGGFKGPLYPVGRNSAEVLNLKAYKSILEIPGPVDFVMVAIPARATPQFLKECAEKKVKTVAFFTAGFTEAGTEEGARLEKEMAEMARQGNFRIIGPNCLGMYVPSSRISFVADAPFESGSFGFFSQSGGHTANTIRTGTARGLLFSKAISYGNGCDLNELDFLDYFCKDDNTRVIGCYQEGAKHGKSFFKLLKSVTEKKPVIVLKGGFSEAGRRAIKSHTASLATEKAIWESMLRQAKAIGVSSVPQMVDAALAFTFLPPGKKQRIGVVGWGGGASVQASDDLEKYGLHLPPLSPDILKKLEPFNSAGCMIGNPLDTLNIFFDLESVKEIIKTVASWEQIDLLVLHLGLGATSDYVFEARRGQLEPIIDAYLAAAKEIKKPVVMVIHSLPFATSWAAAFKAQEKSSRLGIPLYFSLDDAGRAIALFNKYWENRE